MIEQLNRIISSLDALYAEGNAVLDAYIAHVQRRDDLGAQPLPSLRLTHVDSRAGLAMDLRRALELARADLAGERAPPANARPSVPPEFHLDSGVTANLNLKEATRQLSQRRKSHE